MPSRHALLRSVIRNAKVVLGGLALWLVFHPYQGIWHDARLYTVAALRWLNPDAYARDIWFAYGSQDDLTLFSPLYALLIRWIGIADAARAMVLLGAVGWVAASWALCRELLSRRMAIAACLALCMLPLWYSLSGMDVFRVSENFVTARMVAVPLALFGLAAICRRNILMGFVLLSFAAAMHPLMACGPIALAICLCCSDRFQVGMLAATLLALVVAMTNPLAWPALAPIDGTWMALIRSSGASALLYPGDLNLARILACLALLLWAATLAPGTTARRYRTVALVVAWSICVAAVVCFFFPSALLVQMQVWRSVWLALVFAVPAGVQVAITAWQRGGAARWLLLLGGFTLLSGGAGGAAAVLLVWAIYSALSPAALSNIQMQYRKNQRAFSLIGSTMVLLAAPTLYFELVGAGISAPGPALANNGWYLMRAAGVYFLLPFLLWWVLALNGVWQNWLGLALAAVVALSAMGFWDIRSGSLTLREADYASRDKTRLFDGRVPPGATVYWPGNTLRVWYELGTASYAGEEQAVGIVFSRPRTLELWRRMERIQQGPESEIKSTRNAKPNLHRIDKPQPLTVAALRRLCADSTLDYVIDSSRLDGYFVASQEPHHAAGAQTFYLYDCREFRDRKATGG